MIKVNRITKRYGKRLILKDISFEAECGQSIAIVGKNGCGKTTLMQILAGIIKPDQGELTYFNATEKTNKQFFRNYCGYVPQDNPLIEELSVKDNLMLWQGKKQVLLENIIKEFQLEEILKRPVGKLSGGMKRRLSIACSLIEMPPILLMDEPTTALDLYYKDSIHKWMQTYINRNGIIIMTTHDEQEIINCDRCLLMDEGKLVEINNSEKRIQTIKEYMCVS